MAFPIASPSTALPPSPGPSLRPAAPSRGARGRPRTLRPADRGRVDARRDGAGERARVFESLRARALTPLDEVRVLDASAFADLPLPTVLELEVPGWSGPVWLRSGSGPGVATDAPVLDGATWRAVAIAVASDRARPVDFRALLERLADQPEDRLSAALAVIDGWMDGVAPSPCRLRLGQVLDRLGAKLFSVRIEEAEDGVEAAANGAPLAHAG